MGLHRIFSDETLPAPGGEVSILGDEAQHALRVKRIEVGEPVEVLDGRGHVASGIVTVASKDRRSGLWQLRARIDRIVSVAPTSPRVEVWSAVPKGDRLEDMIDQLSQVGVAGWGPLDCERGVVAPREGKLSRLQRRAREAGKQSGRAWALEIGAARGLADVLQGSGRVVVADASGNAYASSAHAEIRLLVGPEGGFDERELARARAAGAVIASFGPHCMRIETAAVVAAGVILDAHRR